MVFDPVVENSYMLGMLPLRERLLKNLRSGICPFLRLPEPGRLPPKTGRSRR